MATNAMQTKFIPMSSSVIVVRPLKDTLTPTGYDFKLLMLKRNPSLILFPGYFAFPGGMVEK